MQIHRRLSSLFVVLAVTLSTGAAAQTNRNLPMVETIDVSIINVDVVVTDGSGKRVRGLKRDDFEILENRKIQTISNFAEYSSSASLDPGAVTADVPQNVETAPRQRRTVVLFVEQMKLAHDQSKRLTEGIRDFFAKTIEPGDAVAIVLWARSSDVSFSFTDDPDEIDRALQQVARFTSRPAYDPATTLREDVVATRDFEARITENAAEAGLRTVLLDPTSAGDAAAGLQATQALAEMKRRVAAINATINSIAGRDGRKILLLATRRLGEVAGGEFFYSTGVDILPAETRQRFGTAELMKSIVDNANSSQVTIYPIYAPGVAAAMPDASVRPAEFPAVDGPLSGEANPKVEALAALNEMVSLSEIAAKTGGLAASSVRDIVDLLPRVEEDLSDYYSLAYRIDSDRGDKVRDIVVRAKNPEYRVRSRRQYVEKADSTRMKDRVVATLYRNFDDSSFPITAEFGTPRKQGRRELFPLRIRIPIRHLTLLPSGEKHAGAFSVFVATSVHVGRLSDVTHQSQSFEIKPAELERALAGHFTYKFDLVVDNAVDRVAIGVFDEISKAYGLLRLAIPGRQTMISANQ